MTLLVRDEDDIIDANMKYHLDAGVDHILVTDNASVDGTADIVHDYVNQGVATYIHEGEDIYAQAKWVTRMARRAANFGAKWVIHCDADEFWIPVKGGSLRKAFDGTLFHNVIEAQRHDFICLEGEDQPFWRRMTYRKVHSTNALGAPLPPKIAHRATPGASVAAGNHAVHDMKWRRYRRNLVEIAHFPLRSRDQYLRKINLGGQAIERNPDLSAKIGDAWRQQYAELRDTGSIAYLDRNVFDADRVDEMLAAGEIVRDRRVEDVMSRLDEAVGTGVNVEAA